MNLSKLKNWWWYHKNMVLLAAVVAAACLYLAGVNSRTVEPDYHVGLVTSQPLPQEQLDRIRDTLCAAGTDCNGDGQIRVQIHAYPVDLADDSPNAGYHNYETMAALDGDLVGNVSGIFLLEDPDTFQRVTGGLLAPQRILWEEDLVLTCRRDAEEKYLQLLELFS